VETSADGDVNFDGAVNTADILLAQRHVLNIIALTPQQINQGDLYPPSGGDGVMGLPDVLPIARAALFN